VNAKSLANFALETIEKSLLSLCPTVKANEKNQLATKFVPKVDQKWQEQVMFKCERKVVRKFALEIAKFLWTEPTDYIK